MKITRIDTKMTYFHRIGIFHGKHFEIFDCTYYDNKCLFTDLEILFSLKHVPKDLKFFTVTLKPFKVKAISRDKTLTY